MGRFANRYCALSQAHEHPAVVAAWQRATGPALAWMTPARRRRLLLAGSLVVLLLRPAGRILDSKAPGLPPPALVPVSILLMLGVLWACFLAAKHFTRLPAAVRRRPQLALHSVFWLLLAVLWLTAPSSGAWRSALVGLAVLLPFFVWRCGYLLLSGQRGRATGTRFRDHLLYLFPAWGGTDTPYGKGLDYLSRCEARTEEELARSQLAGLKLFALAVLWHAAAALMAQLVYAKPGTDATLTISLGVPRLEHLIQRGAGGAVLTSWASVYCELVWQVLKLAAKGHAIVGVLRVFGFNVFRNTYKPLLAESVASFWSRYFYYFKELLSELFFMPVFARWFRRWNRLRLFAAVMAAAGFGNFYFHVLKREHLLIAGDFATLWSVFQSRAFYCVLLAVGIFVSMTREQARKGVPPSSAPHLRIARIAGVWTFFALIYIWNADGRADFWTRTRFFLGLFGLAPA